ncbi:MAG TPA: respiratory nitrate reductase subunit gamma [Polyangia bacterium]|nr:respiratory nitrate reductase subunit gamma [Polyangia bacterium]
MNETAGSFLFRVWPYLAAIVAAAIFAVRLLGTSDRVAAVRRVLPRAQRIYLGGWGWRACWALLAAAHIAGLLFPRAILSLTATPTRLIALEAIGFAVGLAVVVACARTAWLHLARPGRRGWSVISDLADSAFMGLLLVGAASGVLAAGLHRWASAWGPVTVTPYAASLLHGRPAPEFVAHLPLLVRLHLFAAFAALALFPATRLAAYPLLAAHRSLDLAGRAAAAAARPAIAWVRRSPAAWLWPDREIRWVTKPRAEIARKPLGDRAGVLWPRPAHEGGVAAVKHGGKAV